MRAKAILLPLLVVGLLGLMPALIVAGQAEEPIAGVSGGAIGEGELAAMPGSILSLRRAVFEPGGYVSTHHHTGPLILYVESGELTYPIVEGDVEIHRGVDEGTPAASERFGSGEEPVLGAGDWLFEDGIVHGARNDGDTPAVVWLAAVWAADQPGTIFHEEATPAP